MTDLQAVINRRDHFRQLFDNDLFKELQVILKKKQDRYTELLKSAPKVGDIKYQIQESINGSQTMRTKIPFKVTLEEQNEYMREYAYRIDELELVISIPEDIQRDASRAEQELEKHTKKSS